jgi:hypothetical protein
MIQSACKPGALRPQLENQDAAMPPSHVPSCRIPTPPVACRGSLARAVEPGLAREQVLIGAASPMNHGQHVDDSCLACRQFAGGAALVVVPGTR